MRICYIAYSCSPYRGSEDGIGWSAPLEMSKRADVTVITKVEQKSDIERYEAEVGLPASLSIRYCDISTRYKQLYKGSLQSGRLQLWVNEAAKLVKDINSKNPFDVVHQITPVEFRAIGYYRLPNCRVVIGPLGGAEAAPKCLKKYLRPSAVSELIRNCANAVAVRKPSWRRAFRNADVVMFANEETREYVGKSGLDVSNSPVLTELGIDEVNIEKSGDVLDVNGTLPLHDPIRLLYMGRFIPRKGVALLLEACNELRNRGVAFELRLCGFGEQKSALQQTAKDYELQDCIKFFERVPRENFREQFEWSDLVVMPSVRETTGSVISEAATYLRPVLAFDTFGARVVCSKETERISGYLVSAEAGATAIADCIEQVVKEGRQIISVNEIKELRNSLAWSARISKLNKIAYRNVSIFE